MPLTIAKCRGCGDAYHDEGEGWDLCHSCRVESADEGYQDGEYACMNCGEHYLYSPAAPIGFCSSACASNALAEIVAYGRIG